jgi:hypothetical protein
MQKEWYWIEGEYNPTNQGTIDSTRPVNLKPDTQYKEGWGG